MAFFIIYFFFSKYRRPGPVAEYEIAGHPPPHPPPSPVHRPPTHPQGRKEDGLTKRIGDESYNFDPEKQMLHAAVVPATRGRLASLNFNNRSPRAATATAVTRPATFAAVRHAQSKTFHFTIIIVRVPPSIYMYIYFYIKQF